MPSELIRQGDHYDMLISELAVSYEAWAMDNPGVKKDHGFTQQQLLSQIERVRNEKNRKRKFESKDAKSGT